MTKTLEEATKEAVRKEYLCEKCAWKNNCDFCGGENTAFDCCECPADSFEDGFKVGANYVYGLPLASRLTAEEKERFREMYRALCRKWWEMRSTAQEETHVLGKVVMLETIFGTDFFKDEE